MRDHFRLELTGRNQQQEIDKLLYLVGQSGGLVDYSVQKNGQVSYLSVTYDTEQVLRKATRGAGRKKIGVKDGRQVYRIGEVKEMVAAYGLEETLRTLSISRATYFRRWKALKENGYDEADETWNKRFFI